MDERHRAGRRSSASSGPHLPSFQPWSWGQSLLPSSAASFVDKASRVFLVCLPYPSLSFDYTPPWKMSPLGIITAEWRYTSLHPCQTHRSWVSNKFWLLSVDHTEGKVTFCNKPRHILLLIFLIHIVFAHAWLLYELWVRFWISGPLSQTTSYDHSSLLDTHSLSAAGLKWKKAAKAAEVGKILMMDKKGLRQGFSM